MTKRFLPDVIGGYALDKTNFGEIAFVVPQESTNLIIDPSMDTDVGWYGSVNSTLVRVSTEQKYGYWSQRVTRTAAGQDFGIYHNITLSTSETYTFSAYVKAKRGSVIWIEMRIGGTLVLMTRKKYTANGDWQRLVLTFGAPSPTTSFTARIVSSYSTTGIFYTDAWQLENLPYATTWFCGETIIMRNVDNPSAYRWNGTSYHSTSTRFATTREGGRLVTLSDLGIYLESISGLGFRGTENKITTLNDGTGFFDGSIQIQRKFNIVLSIYGKSYEDVKKKVTLLRDCIYTQEYAAQGTSKIIILQYDEWGQQAKELEIRCHFSGPIETEINNSYHKKIALTYDMPIPNIFETGNVVADLNYKTTLAVNYVSMINTNGEWSNLNNGFNGIVYDMIETSDGNIWACGAFTTANGAQCKRLAYWNGVAWNQVTANLNAGTLYCLATDGNNVYAGGNFTLGAMTSYIMKVVISTLAVTDLTIDIDDTVYALFYDPPFDTLYIGGAFNTSTVAGIPTGQADGGAGITKWPYINNMYAPAGNNNMYGTESAGIIYSICKGPDGNIYVTGDFEEINYGAGRVILECGNIAMWDRITETWVDIGPMTGPGIANTVGKKIDVGPDGNIYLGGIFTSVGGVSVSCLAKRVGNSWRRLINSTPPPPSFPGFNLGGDIDSTDSLPVVYDFDWDSNGILTFVGNFNYIGGYPCPESIGQYTANSFTPHTIKYNPPSSDVLRSICISNVNDTYIGNSSSATANIRGSIVKNVQEDVYPILFVHGPGRIESLINRSNGKSVWFGNLSLNDGEVVVIFFGPYGNSFISTVGRDIGACIIGGSDIDFKLSKGDNIIDLTIFEQFSANSYAFLIIDKPYDGIEATSSVSI